MSRSNRKITLGLDLARRWGWCIFAEGQYLKSGSGCKSNMNTFKRAIFDIIADGNVTEIVIEKPARFYNSIVAISKLSGVVEELGDRYWAHTGDNLIPVTYMANTQAKKAMGLKPPYSKQKMIDAVNLKFGLEIEDDNEADSIALTFAYVQNS